MSFVIVLNDHNKWYPMCTQHKIMMFVIHVKLPKADMSLVWCKHTSKYWVRCIKIERVYDSVGRKITILNLVVKTL